jgi:hypothetical protein
MKVKYHVATIALIALSLLGGKCFADEAANKPADATKPAPEKPARNQFWFVGTSNYHLLLHESESRITNQMDRPFKVLFPGWKRPTTFKDWSDEYVVWDMWGGYGFDLSKRFSWSIYGGGGAGTIPNARTYYPLLIPVKFKVDFTRVSGMIGSSVSWFPLGRPEFRNGGILKNILATRPVAEMNIGFNHQISDAKVRLGLPGFDHLVKIKENNAYDLFWTSPRLGFETPVTETNSLNALIGYVFFNDHAREYDGWLLEFFIRHRF